MTDIASEKYVCLTTFTKDGRRKKTPVWVADLGDGTLGIAAEAGTWKVKRIRNTPRVELAPSDGRGRVQDGVLPIIGTARVVNDTDYLPLESTLTAKYGLQFRLFRGFAKLGKRIGLREHLCGIVIELD